MIRSEYTFYLLCIGELCVVFTGFASIPAATALQILILLGIFQDQVFSKDAYRPVAFFVSFSLATVFFTGLALSFPHTLPLLFLLAVTAAFVVVYLIFTENRLQQRFGGSP